MSVLTRITKQLSNKHNILYTGILYALLLWWKMSFVFLKVRRMDLDSGWGSVDKNIKEQELHLWPCRLQLCVEFGVWCRPGCPLNSLLGVMGISWKTVWEWLNKQWKQQHEGRQKTAWPWHCFWTWFVKVIKGDSRKGNGRRFLRFRWKV